MPDLPGPTSRSGPYRTRTSDGSRVPRFGTGGRHQPEHITTVPSRAEVQQVFLRGRRAGAQLARLAAVVASSTRSRSARCCADVA